MEKMLSNINIQITDEIWGNWGGIQETCGNQGGKMIIIVVM